MSKYADTHTQLVFGVFPCLPRFVPFAATSNPKIAACSLILLIKPLHHSVKWMFFVVVRLSRLCSVESWIYIASKCSYLCLHAYVIRTKRQIELIACIYIFEEVWFSVWNIFLRFFYFYLNLLHIHGEFVVGWKPSLDIDDYYRRWQQKQQQQQKIDTSKRTKINKAHANLRLLLFLLCLFVICRFKLEWYR